VNVKKNKICYCKE